MRAGDIARGLAGFGVEIVDDFHMIGDKSDGSDDDFAARRQFLEVLADIGSDPRLRRRSAAALVDQLPLSGARGFRASDRKTLTELYQKGATLGDLAAARS